MPERKIPKRQLLKPQHKPGDIVCFYTSKNDEWSDHWCKKSISIGSCNYLFKDDTLKLPCNNENIELQHLFDLGADGFDGRNKWFAVLCVGTEKTQHSRYFDNLYDERSVYVWYDYCSDKIPTAEALTLCGFIPLVNHEWSDFNKRITKSHSWTYMFSIGIHGIKANKGIAVSEIRKYYIEQEVRRFYRLFKTKNYSSYVFGHMTIQNAIGRYEEKIFIEKCGKKIDTLIDPMITNPEFASPEEYDSGVNAFLTEMRKRREMINSKGDVT